MSELSRRVRIVDALAASSSAALKEPANYMVRNGWMPKTDSGWWSEGEITTVFDEIAAQIPAGATRVLELGCGSGLLASRIAAVRPDITYCGIDIAIPQVQSAQALAGGMGFNNSPVFQVGNTWEFLKGTEENWDFVVSCRHALWDSDEREDKLLMELVFLKCPFGFCIVGNKNRIDALLPQHLGRLASNYTNLTASYRGLAGSGARAFITPDQLKNPSAADEAKMDVLLYTADGHAQNIPLPELYGHLTYINNGKYNRKAATDKIRKAAKEEQAVPTTVEGLTFNSKGVVTAVATKTIATDLKAPLRTKELSPKVFIKKGNQ